MSPEQQRIKIAEACGWTIINDEFGICGTIDGIHWTPLAGIPDYPCDLNAMHDAEKHAIIGPIVRGGKSLLVPYCEMLEELAEDKESAMVATAAQRAETFLKTFSLWTEE